MEWKLALAQHPMYLLIKEDTFCAERTPSWGEPNIERYIERVRQNLAAIRSHPSVKIGFEWSGLELELLAKEGPDVFDEMCALAKEGRIAFYNGTYAQPHLQTLSSEANLRQFEYGMRVYRELCRQSVHVYAHQEASVHDQVPQLMNSVGIEFGVVPAFASTLGWLDESELEIIQGRGPRFMEGHEFVNWRGLDGTQMPLYLRQPMDKRLDDFLAHETITEKLRVPPILLDVPDLISVDEKWIEANKDVEIVLLDEALPERLAKYPPRPRARFYTNWSYIEGIRAEALSRGNWRAETAALNAEGLSALAFALVRRPAEPTVTIWKNILTAQHHDVYCFCSTELKDKALKWLQEATDAAERMSESAAEAIVQRIDSTGQAGQPAVVFSAQPHPHEALVTLLTPVANPMVVDGQGLNVPAESLVTGDGSSQVSFVTRMQGLGYATYWIRGGGELAGERVLNEPLRFENRHYRATVQQDGAFTSLVLLPSGDELLDPATVRGNQLAATDSTGLSPHHPDVVVFGRPWSPPAAGPQLHWDLTAPALIRESALRTTLTVRGQMGSQVKAELSIAFYHQLPRIDLAWTFTFDGASIGTFYDDSSKLRVHWPLAFSGDIYHDIAFGSVHEWEGRPFFPASWTDISDGTKGMAYFHQGTPKHYVEGRTLVNLFAWGEDTEAIGSRLWRANWAKCFDQRLQGSHTIRSAIYPHAGDWRQADVIGAARSYGAAPVALPGEVHTGDLPASKNVLALTDPNAVSTSVRVQGSEVVCRMYAAAGSPASAEVAADGLRVIKLRTLLGEPVHVLAPFKIGELVLDAGEIK